MENLGTNYFDALPNEIVSQILRLLNGKEIVIAQLASFRFNEMIMLPA